MTAPKDSAQELAEKSVYIASGDGLFNEDISRFRGLYGREISRIAAEIRAYGHDLLMKEYEGEDCPVARLEQEAFLKGKSEGFALAREMAASKAQTFKWAIDEDSEVTELIAHRIRALTMPEGK